MENLNPFHELKPHKRILLSSTQQLLLIIISSTVGFIILSVIGGLIFYKKVYKKNIHEKNRNIVPGEFSQEKSRADHDESVLSTPRKGKKVHNPVYDTANTKKKIVKIFSDEESDDQNQDDKELRVIMVDCKKYNNWMKQESAREVLMRQESKIRDRVRVDGGGYKDDEETPVVNEARYMSNNTVNQKIMNLDLRDVIY